MIALFLTPLTTTVVIVFVGLFSCLFMDTLVALITGIRPNFNPLGRWLICFFQGNQVYMDFNKLSPVRYEKIVGWAIHLITGIVYAAVFVLIANIFWRPEHSSLILLACAMTIAWVTMAFPLMLVFPALGLGYFAAKAPSPWRSRIQCFFAHSLFGLGLFFGLMLVLWWL